MPLVRVSMFPRPPEVKKALAEELTKVISRHCGVSDDHTWILFEDVPRHQWSMGGKLQGEPPAGK